MSGPVGADGWIGHHTLAAVDEAERVAAGTRRQTVSIEVAAALLAASAPGTQAP